MKKKLYLFSGIAVILLLCLLAGFAFYVHDYYHADPSVEQYMEYRDEVYTREITEGLFLDGPGRERALIFYPGGKVEYKAYLPLCHKIAAGGIDCFLRIIGGHSLGGAAAAIYAADHEEQVQGLLLLGAYPTKQLGADLYVLELYGSEDRVLNRERLLKGNDFLPVHTVREEIPGGNHAGFGSYGPQKGDGPAGISGEEQQEKLYTDVRAMGATIIAAKGRTHYGIATCVCSLADAILNQRLTIAPITSPLRGEYGINDVSISIPSIIGVNGVEHHLEERWSDDEVRRLRYSAEKMKETLNQLR